MEVSSKVEPATVTLDQVAKTYASQDGFVPALGPLSVHVEPREFVAVVGPSGSGKSTLLRLVADLIPPTSGSVRIGGEAPELARQRRLYGIVFQSPVLFDWRSIAGNVGLPLEVAGWPEAERRRRVEEVLRLVGLSDFAQMGPRQLSGGMQQLASIARALAPGPSILLMDEPFGALDEISRDRLNAELLRIWHEAGVTVLFVTHSIAEAVYLADRVVVLSPRPGRVVADVPVGLPRPRPPGLRSDPAYTARVAEVRRALREGSAPSEPRRNAPVSRSG